MIVMPTSKEIAVCPRCGMEAGMTKDHIVPQWFRLYATYFGTSHKEICERAGLGTHMQRKMCDACNYAKKGTIEFDDILVRKYMKAFMLIMYERLKISEGPRQIMLKCDCKPAQTFEKVVSKKNAISSVQAHQHTHWKGTCWCGYKTTAPDLTPA